MDSQEVREQLLLLIDEKIENIIKVLRTNNRSNSNNPNLYLKTLKSLVEIKEILESHSDSESIINIIREFKDNEPDNNLNNDDGASIVTNATRYLRLLRNSTQSLEYPDSNNLPTKPEYPINRINDPALGLEFFRTYRSMVEHEGTLLNQRINWFLVAQGFLFGAAVTILSAKTSMTSAFVILISVIGFIYSLLVLTPIALALDAVFNLKLELSDKKKKELFTDQVYNLLPKNICYDSDSLSDESSCNRFPHNSKYYRLSILLIPLGTMLIWAIIILLVI